MCHNVELGLSKKAQENRKRPQGRISVCSGRIRAFLDSLNSTCAQRCARVDGQIASIESGGSTINGVTYPYFKDLLPGPFNICHPNCRHRFTPLLEEVADEVRAEKPPVQTHPPIIKAEQEAKSYGVKKVNFGNSKNLPIAKKMNAALKQLVDEGKPVPQRVVVDNAEFKKNYKADAVNVPAMFMRPQPGNKLSTVFINPKADLWANVEENMHSAFTSGRWSSDNPLHAVHHEIGHFLNNNALGNEAYAFFKKTLLTDSELSLILSEVSKYATENPLEFVAETYAGMKGGRKFSDAIMRLYTYFGGVI